MAIYIAPKNRVTKDGKTYFYKFSYNKQYASKLCKTKKEAELSDILSINLRYYRKKYNLSQEKFAEVLGTSLSHLNKIEQKKLMLNFLLSKNTQIELKNMINH